MTANSKNAVLVKESAKIACGESLKSSNSVKDENHITNHLQACRPSTSMQHEGWKEQMVIVRPYPNKKWSEIRWKWSSWIYECLVNQNTFSHDYTLLHVRVCCVLSGMRMNTSKIKLILECILLITFVLVYVGKSSVTPAVGKHYFVNAWRQADVYIECHN